MYVAPAAEVDPLGRRLARHPANLLAEAGGSRGRATCCSVVHSSMPIAVTKLIKDLSNVERIELMRSYGRIGRHERPLAIGQIGRIDSLGRHTLRHRRVCATIAGQGK